jgi:hypothetical protein
MRYNRYTQPEFISYEELFEKLGYKKQYQPRIGNVGRAIIEASKNHRSIDWLKNQLDTYFDKLRGQKKNKGNENKRRKRYPVQRNGQDEA